MRVAPFGYLRIMTYLQLPAAFRSLSRPSSAPGAKASALRPNSLDQLLFDLLRFSFAVLARTRGLSHCHAVSPACPPVFPGCQLIRYLCDNASIDVSRRHPHLIAAVRPLLWDACVSYSSCASHSFELDTFCKIIVYAVFKVRIPQHPSLPAPPFARCPSCCTELFSLFWRPPALPHRLQ